MSKSAQRELNSIAIELQSIINELGIYNKLNMITLDNDLCMRKRILCCLGHRI